MTPAELKEALDTLGLPVRKAAEAWGYSHTALYNWLTGKQPVPKIVALYLDLRVAEARRKHRGKG